MFRAILAAAIVLTLAAASHLPASGDEPDKAQADVAPVVETPIWPATGIITSRYGPGHPLGIDVGIPQGTPILAATSGFVIFAGGQACCEYGLYAVIDNGQGVQTLYAHLSVIFVWQGQWIMQGDIIGNAGHTGHATGPHLHFEVRKNGTLVNPMSLLP